MSSGSSKQKSNIEEVRYFDWIPPLFGYSFWIAVAFVLSYLVLYAIQYALSATVPAATSWMSGVGGMIFLGSILYALLFIIVVYVPKILFKKTTSIKVLGIDRLPSWKDIGFALIGMVVYFVLAGVVLAIVSRYFEGFDADQAQDIGFDVFPTGVSAVAAFFLLVVVAPVFEELIFRGYLFGHFKNSKVPIIINVLVVSSLFGLAHGQWNVGINVAVLSVVMCAARLMTGSIWTGIMIHMMKNGLAFYLLSTGIVAVIL
jgi:membrane protease YdiL (CAAX protease family)